AVEIGGYLHECGCMKAVDKKLDSDPVGNHRFLQQRENLVKQKMENPALKMTKSLRESINVEEEVVTGLKGPKKRFLELSAYERKFGPAPEDQIKQQVYNGQTLLGVDVIDEDDVGVYEYIDQNITKVARVDEGDQTESKRSKDDQAVIDGYIAQLIPLLKLDAEKSDDSGFAPWQKDKTKNLNELKSSILTKKKSLKRRTAADASALTDELDKIVADVNAHIGLLKQLSLGTLEGSNTYDNIKCLVKEKGDDIIQALHDALSNNDDLLDGSCEDNMNVSLAILNVMDLRTPPSQVNNAVQLLNSSSHWLASAFKLDKGKRMTQLALENAANRENQNGILEKIGEHTSALEEQAITDENDLSGDPLGAAYGKLLSDALEATQDKAAKLLKGVDKDAVKTLAVLFDDSVHVALIGCITADLLPYLIKLKESIPEATPVDPQVLLQDACIFSLPSKDHAYHKLVSTLRDTFTKLTSLAGVINNALSKKESFENSDGMLSDLQELNDPLLDAVKQLLCGQVDSEASTCIKHCMNIVSDHLLSSETKKPLDQSSLDSFKKNLEDSMRLSSVMGDRGVAVRVGLHVLDIMVSSYQCLSNPDVMRFHNKAPIDEVDSEEFACIGKLNKYLHSDAVKADADYHWKTLDAMISAMRSDSADESDVQEGKNFVTGSVNLFSWLEKTSDQFGKSVKAAIEQTMSKVVMPCVSIPNELFKYDKIDELVKHVALVKETFPDTLNTQVMNDTMTMETCLKELKQFASALHLSTTDLSNGQFETLEANWRACVGSVQPELQPESVEPATASGYEASGAAANSATEPDQPDVDARSESTGSPIDPEEEAQILRTLDWAISQPVEATPPDNSIEPDEASMPTPAQPEATMPTPAEPDVVTKANDTMVDEETIPAEIEPNQTMADEETMPTPAEPDATTEPNQTMADEETMPTPAEPDATAQPNETMADEEAMPTPAEPEATTGDASTQPVKIEPTDTMADEDAIPAPAEPEATTADVSAQQLKSNLTMALDYLSEIGFACHATKLRANDYGLPQRRCRYYIFGLRIVSNLSEHARLLVEKIPLRLQAMSSTVCEPVETFLLDDDNAFVMYELKRRVDADEKKSQSSTASEKWVDSHSSMAESMGVQWPLSASVKLQSSSWFKTLPRREQEVVPTILPGQKLWSVQRMRPLLGSLLAMRNELVV
ncbi:unnamed protein product, partial [Durusdinium trenchii]